MIKEKLKSLFVRWFLIYYVHGYRRYEFVISWLYRILVVIGILGIWFGWNPKDPTTWIGFSPLILVIIVVAFAACTITGYLDYTKRGTYVPEQLRRFELSPISLIQWNVTLSIEKAKIKALGGTIPQELEEMHEWVKESLRRLGLSSLQRD